MLPMKDTGLRKAIKAAGSQSELARWLGCTPSAVCQWTKVPPEHVGPIETRTGIPSYELRPDLFSKPIKKTGS